MIPQLWQANGEIVMGGATKVEELCHVQALDLPRPNNGVRGETKSTKASKTYIVTSDLNIQLHDAPSFTLYSR